MLGEFGSMIDKRVEFPCQDILLEGILSTPDGPDRFSVVVVCHPHPLYGGNMYNNVVEAVCAKLGEDGIAWLRFNFRGVGRSGGDFSGGLGEREDVKAAISFAEVQPKIDARKIGVCGYSFGSIVAFAVAVEDERVKAVAGISPFVEPPDLLNHCQKPKLFICGENDEFINAKNLQELVRGLPDPKELAIFTGSDHFWGGDEDAMAERVSKFFKTQL